MCCWLDVTPTHRFVRLDVTPNHRFVTPNSHTGLLGSGMVCSGLMGNSAVSHTAQALALEDMKKYLDTITSMKECGYGRR